MDEGTWRNLTGAHSMLLSVALERYLEEVSIKKKPRTAARDKLSASYLRLHLGKLTLTRVTPDKLATYRDKRLRDVSPHSVRLELALLSNLFNVARREWAIGEIENPASMVEKPRLPEGRSPMLSEDQIRRLIDECRKSRAKLLYPFVLLALHTGCRSLELRSLHWSQVDLERGRIVITVESSRSRRTRTVPLTPAALGILRQLAAKHKINKTTDQHDYPSGLVFPARGNPDKPRDMHMAFDRAVRRAGLDSLPGIGKLRIHDLRHLCGTYLLMTGSDVETVRKILGHRDVTTTQRYLHVVEEHKKKAISRIGHLGLENEEDLEET
jgi:integrase